MAAGIGGVCFISMFLTLLLTLLITRDLLLVQRGRTRSTALFGIGHQVKQRNP